ncbi:MAG: DUF1232 domain-containing protein [Myxococcales bacterium]|nr:DUF1232 domain-containing protein [Myxococcales bacterium]
MPPIRVTLKLADEDVGHLTALMEQAIKSAASLSESEIRAAAVRTIETTRSSKAPDYVLERIENLELATRIMDDPDWKVPPGARTRIVTALSYFSNPVDLIPDSVPGLGFLDDTIMIELLTRDLRHEIAGFRDFLRYRERALDGGERRQKRIENCRKRLRARIQERQHRDADRTPWAIRRLFGSR